MEQQNFFTAPQPMQPLAARLRPQSLEEFVGQRHLLAPGKVLWRLIEGDHISSMIFWGPPGVGKTTLARIIANRTKAKFIDFSAVTSGIKEIREVMQSADHNALYGEKTIVFVDEIHRFNKAQQDAFLPFVEKGSIVLIGATTENPSFEVNGALLSRCKVFVLHALTTDDLTGLPFNFSFILLYPPYYTVTFVPVNVPLIVSTMLFGSFSPNTSIGILFSRHIIEAVRSTAISFLSIIS